MRSPWTPGRFPMGSFTINLLEPVEPGHSWEDSEYGEEALLPLSGLQHLAFCERQFALIHLEGIWADNRLTVLGGQLHERVHAGGREVKEDLVVCRAVSVRSLRLGLIGKADVLEFRRLAQSASRGVSLPGAEGCWLPCPVEYKRGSPKITRCDKVQLCAQAMCLEEMLNTSVEEGFIYYGEPRRRQLVTFDADLREETNRLAVRLHELVAARLTPTATYTAKCRACSLLDACMPRKRTHPRSARRYTRGVVQATTEYTPEVPP